MDKRTFEFGTDYNTSKPGGTQHYHDSYELYFLIEGVCRYQIEGVVYDMQAGDMICIKNQKIHGVAYSGEHSRLLINCCEELIEGLPFPKEEPVFRNPVTQRELRSLFAEVEQEYKKDDEYSLHLLKGYLHRILILMERNENKYVPDKASAGIVEKVLGELSSDFSSGVTLNELAERHYVSPAHLSRIFKREIGMNFNEYISLIRLKNAEKLLREQPWMSISEIAFASGFNDSNYFSKKFHDAHGCSPSAFCRREGLRRKKQL